MKARSGLTVREKRRGKDSNLIACSKNVPYVDPELRRVGNGAAGDSQGHGERRWKGCPNPALGSGAGGMNETRWGEGWRAGCRRDTVGWLKVPDTQKMPPEPGDRWRGLTDRPFLPLLQWQLEANQRESKARSWRNQKRAESRDTRRRRELATGSRHVQTPHRCRCSWLAHRVFVGKFLNAALPEL